MNKRQISIALGTIDALVLTAAILLSLILEMFMFPFFGIAFVAFSMACGIVCGMLCSLLLSVPGIRKLLLNKPVLRQGWILVSGVLAFFTALWIGMMVQKTLLSLPADASGAKETRLLIQTCIRFLSIVPALISSSLVWRYSQ